MLDDTVLNYETPLYMLFAATGCVLLIACLNAAGLLMARAAARSKELAIRAALGGGRLRLLRERVTETLLISAAGGVLGLVLARAELQQLMSPTGYESRRRHSHRTRVRVNAKRQPLLLACVAIFQRPPFSACFKNFKLLAAHIEQTNRLSRLGAWHT
jgi:putative ABC transport system permease protein